MNNTGVTGRILPHNTDFEHARVWPTYFRLRFLDHDRHTYIHTYRPTYIYISREISIEHPSVGLASLAQQMLVYMLSSKYGFGQSMDCLHRVWILTLSGQSMDCLLNPWIEHAQSTDWGNPWIVCSIQGLSMLKVRIRAIHGLVS